MFGIFGNKESEVHKASRLAHDFFEALKTDDPDIFTDKKFAQASLDKCCVLSENLTELVINIQEQKVSISVDRGELLSCKAWSDLKFREFVYFRSQYKEGKKIYTPLSYLVQQGKIQAVEYLLKKRIVDPNDGLLFQSGCTGSFLRPLYYATKQKEMAKLLLSYNAAVSDDMMWHAENASLDIIAEYAVRANQEAVKKLAIHKFRNIESANKFLQQISFSELSAEEFQQFSPVLQSEAPDHPCEHPKEKPEEKKAKKEKKKGKKQSNIDPPHIVRIERDLGQDRFVDVYDFEMRERVTMVEVDHGKLQPVLRDAFNKLGRSDYGLQKAFEVYAQKGGALSLDELFDKPAPIRLAINKVNPASPTSGQ